MNNQAAQASPHFYRRLHIGFFLFVLGIMALACLAIFSMVTVNGQRTRLTEIYARAQNFTKDLQYLQATEDTLVLRFVLSGDPATYGEIQRIRSQFLDRAKVMEFIEQSPDTVARLRRIRDLKQQLVDATASAMKRRAEGAALEATHALLEERGGVLDGRLRGELAALFDLELKRFGQFRKSVDQTTDMLLRDLIFGAFLIAAAFLLIACLLTQLARTKRVHEHDLQRLYERVKRTAEVRKEVVETVSHDLKNLLAAIELRLQLVEKYLDSGNADKAGKSTAAALRSVYTMKDFLRCVLDQATLEAGSPELDLQSGNMRALVEDVTDLLAPLAENKSVGLAIRGESSLPPCRFDRQRMSQVIANVLENAIKFTPPGGLITLETSSDRGAIRLCVADTGPGIAQDQLEHVFERFWQARSGSKQGTGLGLAIAKAVVEAHAGRIWVESEPGRGTKFHIEMAA